MSYTPVHPGIILRKTVFDHIDMDISEAAKRLHVARISLSRVLNGHAGISPDLSLRLEKAGISKARLWNTLQANYNLWKARQKPIPDIKPIEQPA